VNNEFQNQLIEALSNLIKVIAAMPGLDDRKLKLDPDSGQGEFTFADDTKAETGPPTVLKAVSKLLANTNRKWSAAETEGLMFYFKANPYPTQQQIARLEEQYQRSWTALRCHNTRNKRLKTAEQGREWTC